MSNISVDTLEKLKDTWNYLISAKNSVVMDAIRYAVIGVAEYLIRKENHESQTEKETI